MTDDNDLMMSRAIGDIATERSRQVAELKRTRDYDDRTNTQGEMAKGAAMYAFASTCPDPKKAFNNHGQTTGVVTISVLHELWPLSWRAPTFESPRTMLVKAGALIVAEIERLDRKAARREMIERERRPLPEDKPEDKLGIAQGRWGGADYKEDDIAGV